MDKVASEVWYQSLTQEEEKLWFEQKIKECQPKLTKFAYHLTRNSEKAQDLIQEALLRAFKYRKSYKPQYPFSNWVCTILLNVHRQKCKKEKLMRFFVPWKEDGEEEEDLWEFIAVEGDNPEEKTIKNQIWKDLGKVIEELPPKMKEVVVLCDLLGHSYEETSEIVGCPLGTVRSRLHRARKKIKQSVEEKYGSDFLATWG
ncbi:MAG: polymerase sigma-70 factor, subfamily [Candidatus Atribacteria bacterium]|nr:polymerase sigma-70 factor, subfamily [Candidatus Atribacteria bacterium]